MKQHITEEQWLEVNDRGIDYTIETTDETILYGDMNIVGMIEFLGDDLCTISKNGSVVDDDIPGYIVCLNGPEFEEEELLDALWQAVKYKLNE